MLAMSLYIRSRGENPDLSVSFSEGGKLAKPSAK